MRFNGQLFRSLTVILLLSSTAWANGIYMPEKAYPVNPSIPVQRALITYRGGIETLVVESTYQTNSPNVGWILPLPAEPTKLEQADSGLLPSLSMCLRPTITHDISREVTFVVVIAIILVPFVLVFILKRAGRGRLLLGLTLVLFLILFVAIIFIPAFSGMTLGRGGASVSMPGATEVQSQRVGNYQATVLKATDGNSLSAWLQANSLKGLDEAAKRIADDYAARKWCFVVARLHKDGDGPATPHPIAATFPTASAVFPMKLTALAGSVTHVELFVAADEQATAPGFDCIAADRFADFAVRDESKYYYSSFRPSCKARSTGLIIGSPDAGERLWPDCAVTKLVADLNPQQMSDDVGISFQELVPYRQHVFSSTGRWYVILLVLFGAAIPMLVWAAIAFRGLCCPGKKHLATFKAAILLILLACAGLYAFLPVIPVQAGRNFRNHMDCLQCNAEILVMDGKLNSQMTPEEILAKISSPQDPGDDFGINLFTRQKIRLERTPGNVSIRKIGGDTYICFYDEDCSECRVRLP
jgi:hypothetical protein